VEQIIENIKPDKELTEINQIYYIVQRPVNVRIKPSNKSNKLDILYPNNKVRLIKSRHKWIFVEYFDFIEGIPKTGWVYKKYLIRVK
jgi:hypothetical protein